MQEEYLHYLFKHQFFSNTFTSVKGESIEIINRGQHNHNAGPDFLEGKITYDNKVWAGHIEFHVKSSDWLKHGHQNDVNYNNVIVHFVYEYDRPIFIDGYEVPTIELKNLIDRAHYNHYLKFKNSKDWIACSAQIHLVNDFTIFQQKEKALINRLIRKSDIILQDIKRFKGNQHKAFWIALGKVFGGKVNAEAFASLVFKIEAHHLAHLNYDLKELEAYCFGIAGFLNNPLVVDDYFDELREKFWYQQKLFDMESLNEKIWKFSRMRPGNFPTIRIAQFASLLAKTKFNYVALKPNALKLLTLDLSRYWQQHYHFGKKSTRMNSGLTLTFKSLITINALLPFLFAVGLINDQAELKESAIDALSDIKSESNSIIKHWRELDISSKTAFDSQALIEQKNEFCDKSMCLNCKIGLFLLNFKK